METIIFILISGIFAYRPGVILPVLSETDFRIIQSVMSALFWIIFDDFRVIISIVLSVHRGRYF